MPTDSIVDECFSDVFVEVFPFFLCDCLENTIGSDKIGSDVTVKMFDVSTSAAKSSKCCNKGGACKAADDFDVNCLHSEADKNGNIAIYKFFVRVHWMSLCRSGQRNLHQCV